MELTGKQVLSLFRLTPPTSRGRQLDNDAYLNEANNEKLGDISLTLWRTRFTGGKPEPISSKRYLPEDARVHERSKKGLSHCVACVIEATSETS
jgi:hypothetical protein